jgi:2-deoxy-D-gluconate 3-dehydrogenase
VHANATSADATAASVTKAGRRSHALTANLEQDGAAAALAAGAIDVFGHVDILVNNAGTIRRSPAADHPMRTGTR